MSLAEQIEGIAATLATYRTGEIAPVNAARVERWLGQFDAHVRPGIAAELRHVFGEHFVSEQRINQLIELLPTHTKMTGGDHAGFWRTASLFDGQRNGGSQRAMTAKLRPLVAAATGVEARDRPDASTLVYLDDILFSGTRIATDLLRWIRGEAPRNPTIEVILWAKHEPGEYFLGRNLRRAAHEAGKNLTITFRSARLLNGRRDQRDTSDVLWPAAVPPEAAAYQQQWCPDFQPRTPGRHQGFFSSEAGRALLEQEFLKAGLRIRGFCANPSPILRPLGFSNFGFGFGSMLVTWRNCPNNAPLALWWGDPEAPLGHPFRNWFPLVPRATYGGDGF